MLWVNFELQEADHDRFQIYDGDGGFHTSPTHPAYGFVRNHPDSMMLNWNALRGHFGGHLWNSVWMGS